METLYSDDFVTSLFKATQCMVVDNYFENAVFSRATVADVWQLLNNDGGGCCCMVGIHFPCLTHTCIYKDVFDKDILRFVEEIYTTIYQDYVDKDQFMKWILQI